MTGNREESYIQHVFIIGAKSIGQYGGYETFVNRLIEEHKNVKTIQYHIACKANGDGSMDETQLSGIEIVKKDENNSVTEFMYRNAHVFKITCPNIGPAVAIYYDRAAMLYSLDYCRKHNIVHPIFYILTCRIGLFIRSLTKKIRAVGGILYLNPDGHEWKRAKWTAPVRKYWKWSEKKMVECSDTVICDSINIEKYIRSEYGKEDTVYISYGADLLSEETVEKNKEYNNWVAEKKINAGEYYLVVGRFVPENNYETMIREFMMSKSKRDFVIVSNVNDRLSDYLETTLHFSSDPRIKFVGTVYDQDLLKLIRKNAYAYFHGHEVGGTNPSLLEALACTDVNLLLDVAFNREVAQDAAVYWNKDEGSLAKLIDKVDSMSALEKEKMGIAAKNRIRNAYSWEFIGQQYLEMWNKRTK